MEKKDEMLSKIQDNSGKIAILLFISIVLLIFFFSVDIGLLYEISQNPEYFYASETVGLSMYPNVYTGDMFIIQSNEHPGFNLAHGDIIVYYKENSEGEGYFVGHRIIGIYNDYYLVKGDANSISERVYPEQIVGEVIKTIDRYNPIGQYMFLWVANQDE